MIMARSQEKKSKEIILKDHADIINQVESLRSRLEDLIALKENPIDLEVLAASRALDEMINKFYRVCC